MEDGGRSRSRSGGRPIVNSFKSVRSKVLTAKHMASLQLLYTAGGNQAKLDARTEFRYLAVPKG